MKIDMKDDTVIAFGKKEKLVTTINGHYCMPLVGGINNNVELKVDEILTVNLQKLSDEKQFKVMEKTVRVSANRLMKQGEEFIKTDDGKLVENDTENDKTVTKNKTNSNTSRPVVAVNDMQGIEQADTEVNCENADANLEESSELDTNDETLENKDDCRKAKLVKLKKLENLSSYKLINAASARWFIETSEVKNTLLPGKLLDRKVTIIPNKQTPDIMYVDVIPLFCTSLASGTSRAMLGLELSVEEETRILGGGHRLTRQAEDVVNTMTSLADLLQEQRGAHRQMVEFETEREQVDVSADDMAGQCRNLIGKFSSTVVREKPNESAEEHYELVATGPEKCLKSVVSIHTEMRAARVANQIQQNKLSRLEVNSVAEQVQFRLVFSVSWCVSVFQSGSGRRGEL